MPVDQSVGQTPLVIDQAINSAGVSPKATQDIHALAKQIIRDNQPIINRFVSVQRQQVELGEKDIHSNVLPLRDLTVYYQNVGGLERMHYHISPKVEEPPEKPAEPPAAPEPPKPPAVEEPPAPLDLRAPEPEVPKPAEPPEVPEDKVPEEKWEPPEEEQPPEEEKRRGAPEFLEVDIPCFLAVEFGDGAS